MNTENNKQLTVVFADICRSTHLFESIGDRAAAGLVSLALSRAAKIVSRNGGNVIRARGDDVLCVFESNADALLSANQIHAATAVDPELSPHHLAFRIGMHRGPVTFIDDEIFGDTVNFAARLVAEAKRRQSLISEAVQRSARTVQAGRVRRIGALSLRGKTGTQVIYELLEPESTEEITEVTSMRRIRARSFLLEIRFRSQTIRMNPLSDRLLLGRAANCSIVIDNPTVSREHAEITYTNGQFIFRDFSSNGSTVYIEEVPRPLQRSTLQLLGKGTIFLGRTWNHRQLAIAFKCIDSQSR